jgi:folate-dependent phosphoribosylglycinamide formyltransferase PurN
VWDGSEPERLLRELDAHGIDLIVLAGWLRLVPGAVVRGFRDRMINIHPALLPAFGGAGMYGLRVHEAVIAAGARISGATVHLVDDEYDSGRILAQWPVPVLSGDTAAELAARVLEVEHRLLPAVVAALARGQDPATASWLPPNN